MDRDEAMDEVNRLLWPRLGPLGSVQWWYTKNTLLANRTPLSVLHDDPDVVWRAANQIEAVKGDGSG